LADQYCDLFLILATVKFTVPNGSDVNKTKFLRPRPK